MPRTPLRQTFTPGSIAVTAAAQPINQIFNQTAMIQSFILDNFSANTISVFLGDINVQVNTGLELVPGNPLGFVIRQDRQLYELQDPLVISASADSCNSVPPVSIPFVVWDMTTIYAIASAPVTIGFWIFNNVYS